MFHITFDIWDILMVVAVVIFFVVLSLTSVNDWMRKRMEKRHKINRKR